jgi:hypothetical protein
MSYRSRVTDRDDWFEIWEDDKESILQTMIKNMASDLDHGYDYFGKSITEQRKAIEEYRKEIDDAYDKFKSMEDKEVNRWCFYDLKKRGAII